MEWVTTAFICVLLYVATKLFRSRRMLDKLHLRHVFITGCDTGFGHLLAIRLDEMGFNVFAGCLSEKGCSEIQKKASSRLVALLMDVTDVDSIKKSYETVSEKLPEGQGLWGLVNNAGVAGLCGPAEWFTKEDYRTTLEVNLFGVIETTRIFLPLVRQGRGRIVNMSSANGSVTVPYFVPYTISKYGVEVFSDSLRPECLKYGVTVHIIKPGMFDTNIRQVSPILEGLKKLFDRLDTKVKQFYGADFVSELTKMASSSPKASSNISSVVDGYVHALTARYPQYRYRVGLDSCTLWRLLEWLPEWLTDLVYMWVLPTPRPVYPQI